MMLQVQGVTKNFVDGQHRIVRAVDEVSLEVGEREAVGLVGESGSGKTTLIQCLMRLLPVDAGQITYDGIDVTRARGADLRRFRREVQLVFQDPYVSLNHRMNVEQLVGEGLLVHKLGSAASRRERIVETLELVGLSSADLRRHPRSFSGGQRQRIAIARALATRPRLLVCDEPVASLDVSVQAQVINLLRDMREELGLSILFIAHDLAVVRSLCSRVSVLRRGRIVEAGPSDVVFEHPQAEYTRALLDAVPVPDPVYERRRRADRLGLSLQAGSQSAGAIG
jgi:ABC-type glutathione transport system ATPase component